MIIIFTEESDGSTYNVLKWLDHFKVKYIIVFEHTFVNIKSVLIDNKGNSFSLQIRERVISSDEISGIWYRRGMWLESSNHIKDAYQLFYKQEEKRTIQYIINELNAMPSIGRIGVGSINKLAVLKTASKLGLKIPKTFVSRDENTIIECIQNEGEVICKAIHENTASYNDQEVTLPVHKLKYDEVEKPLGFLKLQSNVSKKYEIRVFHFFGENFSMAMFTQQNEKTKLDFRNYDLEKPIRWVPFELPYVINKKINKLMKLTNNNTGSIDLIMDDNNEFVFLEINPIGQYDFIAGTCNYKLDKLIALKLKHFYEAPEKLAS